MKNLLFDLYYVNTNNFKELRSKTSDKTRVQANSGETVVRKCLRKMKTPRRGCVFWRERERESVFAPSFQIVSSVRVPQTHRSALCPLEKEGETNGIKSDKGQTSVSVSSRFYSTDWEQSEGEARERERGSEWEGKAQAGKQRDTRREEGEEGEVGEVGDMDTAAETPLYCDTHRALDLRSYHRGLANSET